MALQIRSKKILPGIVISLTLLGLTALWGTQLLAKSSSGSEQSVKPGINSSYLNPNLNVDCWMSRFEIESREVFAQRLTVLKAIGLNPGENIADIGAGTGFYSELFAETTGPKGHVFAIDIAPNFLRHINKRSQKHGLNNITTVLGRENSITLPANSLDKAFICDVYHHFEFPQSSMKSVYTAMKSGGELVVIDFKRIRGFSSPWLMNHVRGGKKVFRAEIEQAGFTFVEEVKIAGFRDNYFLRFVKK